MKRMNFSARILGVCWISLPSVHVSISTTIVNLGQPIHPSMPPMPASISTVDVSSDQPIHIDEAISQDQREDRNKGKLRSSAWSHFTKVEVHEVSKAKCNYCTKLLSGDSKNGTRHLHNHYKVCPRRRYRDIKQQILVNNLAKDGTQTMSVYSFN